MNCCGTLPEANLVNDWCLIELDDGTTYYCHKEGRLCSLKKPGQFYQVAWLQQSHTVCLSCLKRRNLVTIGFPVIECLKQIPPAPKMPPSLADWELWMVYRTETKFFYNKKTGDSVTYATLASCSIKLLFKGLLT